MSLFKSDNKKEALEQANCTHNCKQTTIFTLKWAYESRYTNIDWDLFIDIFIANIGDNEISLHKIYNVEKIFGRANEESKKLES